VYERWLELGGPNKEIREKILEEANGRPARKAV
jgi:hypothetical protein